MPVRSALAFADLWTLARASIGTAFAGDGTFTEYAANLPRPDHDPTTLQFLGLAVEAAATNQVTNPRREGAVVGSPGTVPTGWTVVGVGGYSHQVVGLGAEDGIPYIDLRVYAPAAAGNSNNYNFRLIPSIALTAGETWTGSIFHRLIAGDVAPWAFRLYIGANSNAASLLPTPTTAPLRTQRVSITRTMAATEATAAISYAFVTPGPNGAGNGDVTIRIGLPQLTLGAARSSIILPPAGTPGVTTRPAEDIQAANPASWFNGAAGTFVLDVMPGQSSAAAERGLLGLSDGTANNTVDLRLLAASNVLRLTVVSGGVTTVVALDTAAATALARSTVRLSYGPAGWLLSLNGGAPVAAAGAMPPGISVVRLGRKAGTTDVLQGWLGPRVQWFGRQYTDVVADDGFTIRTR